MISRAIFIGDPYRGEQAVNIEKISALFSPVMRQLGLTVENVITGINRETDRELWIPAWQKSLDVYPARVAESIDTCNAVVIGFETPEIELAYLTEKKTPWINFCIHPLRFLDDLYFEVTTSFPYEMSDMEASRGLIDFCASNFSKHRTWREESPFRKTLLVCGQDWIDRSIYFNNRFCDLEFYAAQLDKLALDFDTVLYKPHPSWRPKRIKEMMVARYQATECLDNNIYDLFCEKNISAVCAISSSVLTEAPYFGVQSIYLEPKAKRYGPAVSYRLLIDNANFWEVGLLGRKASQRSLRISCGVPSNHLRKTFSSWGFITEESLLENRLFSLEQRMISVEALVAGLDLHKNYYEKMFSEIKAKADDLRLENTKLDAARVELDMVRRSWSWRVTKPFRTLVGMLLNLVGGARLLGNALIYKLINFCRIPLLHLMGVFVKNRRVSEKISLWLVRNYPALHAHLLEIYSGGKKMAVSKTDITINLDVNARKSDDHAVSRVRWFEDVVERAFSDVAKNSGENNK